MKKKILIVDDDSLLLKILADQFSQNGFEVVTANDGEAGLELFKKEKPDIVLADVLMPKKTGIEMLEAIRQEFPDDKTPAFILSDSTEMENVEGAVQHAA